MARIFITGSSDGLGLAAARTLIGEGHQVYLHARSAKRAADIGELAERSAGVLICDLSSLSQTRALADEINKLGTLDAVIHNAGTYLQETRGPSLEGHAVTLAVNMLAPYLLTSLIQRPKRLVYLSSDLHRSGQGNLEDMDWTRRRWNAAQAYADSKLFITAFAFALARLWPDVLSHVVTPGWVATKMGGPNATDDFDKGYLTQTWLATGDDAAIRMGGHYWFHRQHAEPLPLSRDVAFQAELLARLADMTGQSLA